MQVRSNKLIEGESYSFLIYKIMHLPGENQKYFILIGPDDKKYLLDTRHYQHYGMLPGQKIKCRIDKINCSGRVFLEPEHPFYKLGMTYQFPVLRISRDTDAWGNVLYRAWVADLHNRERSCVIDEKEGIKPGAKIKCTIEKIKKSEIILSYPEMELSPIMIKGKFYEFLIIGEKENERVPYFILEGPDGRNHLLEKEYFYHYNFKKGDIISAKILGRRPDLSYRMEPENPYYKIGQVYDFKLLKLELFNNKLGELEGIIHLEDELGQKTEIKAHDWQIESPGFKPDSLKCKVIRFKKGKLQLENIESGNSEIQ